MKRPYYRKRLKCWYFKAEDGKEIRLDPNEDVAHEMWVQFRDSLKFAGCTATVSGILTEFLVHHKNLLSETRFKTLSYYASLFAEDHPGLLASEVTIAMVQKWLSDPKPPRHEDKPDLTWSSNTQRHAAALLRRVWSRAKERGFIRDNVLADLRLPPIEYRKDVIDLSIHVKLVQKCLSRKDSKPFALYLIASRCGARPQQVRGVTADKVSQDGTCWIFAKHKTATKTQKPLIVYLNPCLQTLTKILLQGRKGHLFVNYHGNPWKKDTVSQRMKRLRETLKLPSSVVAYLYRHTFATDALVSGLNPAVVAELLGHKDTRMLVAAYSHLEHHNPHMLEAVAKVRRKS